VVFWQNFAMQEALDDSARAGGVVASPVAAPAPPPQAAPPSARPREIGGREGPDPTRYGDWELRGRCIDF